MPALVRRTLHALLFAAILSAVVVVSCPAQEEDQAPVQPEAKETASAAPAVASTTANTGRMVIEPQFDRAGNFSDGLAPAVPHSKAGVPKVGYIDKTGKFVIEPQFEQAGVFLSGRAPVKVKGKWGFIDRTGRFVIDPQLESAGVFLSEIAPFAVKGGKWGFIDRNGKTVIEPQFDKVDYFDDGYAVVCINDHDAGKCGPRLLLVPVVPGGRWGMIDKSGRYGIAPQFGMMNDFSDGLAAVCTSDNSRGHRCSTTFEETRWGFVDKTGKLAFAAQFDLVRDFSDGLAGVCVNTSTGIRGSRCNLAIGGGKWGFIDKTGRLVISPQFDFVGAFVDGHALACASSENSLCNSLSKGGLSLSPSGGQWSIIDRTGKIVTSLPIDLALRYSGGVAQVCVNDDVKTGLGRCAVPSNVNGIFKPRGGKWGFIDRSGRFVVIPQFNEVSDFSQGLAAVRVSTGTKYRPDFKWGFVDQNGKVVIEPKFDAVSTFTDDMAAVKVGEKWGYISR
ncbi:MAG: WG repeat-containing protein [Acidobacteriaceae bacterium]|nr:WG repeat-containing protein [Acidobacteriaceae bacterium]